MNGLRKAGCSHHPALLAGHFLRRTYFSAHANNRDLLLQIVALHLSDLPGVLPRGGQRSIRRQLVHEGSVAAVNQGRGAVQFGGLPSNLDYWNAQIETGMPWTSSPLRNRPVALPRRSVDRR